MIATSNVVEDATMSREQNKDPEIKCCLRCGRDTRGLYCNHCIGHIPHTVRAGHPPDVPLEDDYGEESDPDSVCDDNPEHPYGKWV